MRITEIQLWKLHCDRRGMRKGWLFPPQCVNQWFRRKNASPPRSDVYQIYGKRKLRELSLCFFKDKVLLGSNPCTFSTRIHQDPFLGTDNNPPLLFFKFLLFSCFNIKSQKQDPYILGMKTNRGNTLSLESMTR